MRKATAKITKLALGLMSGVAMTGGWAQNAQVMTDTGYSRAFGLYQAGQYSDAAIGLHPYAERGDPRAQLCLATLYRTGSGVEADEYEAARWYRVAASSGIAEAQFHLGLMYLEGIGVTENTDEALEWISRAAKQGYGEAIEVFKYMLSHDPVLAC